MMNSIEFLGLDCIEIKTGHLSLLAAKSVGPRILSLSVKGGKNLFAELPNDYLEYPGEDNFCFYGGHRLWLGPEYPPITYIPDSQPVSIRESPGLYELIQEPHHKTGIRKSIRIRIPDLDNIVVINHIIQNEGKLPFTCAPWAITQFRLGGHIIIPQQYNAINKNALLPDRSIVLWPYSDINDPRIHWGNHFIILDSDPLDTALKIGVSNKEKWMAYFCDNLLFIKYADDYESKQLIDYGATSECYLNSKFVELETMGPLTLLEQGQTIQHTEIWRVVEKPFVELTPTSMMDFISHDEMAKICLDMLK